MVEKEKKWTKEEYKKWLSYDKTSKINEESDKMERDKHDFMNFCWYRRRLKKVRPGRVKINEDENGEGYTSIQVKAEDCPEEETERNELRLDKENDFKFNEDFKYKFSFKIPENFPLSPTRLVIWQWKYNKIEGSDEKKDPSPMLAQRIKKIDWEYFFVITDWTKEKNILWKIPFDEIKGKWVDMDYELKFSDKKDENGDQIPCSVKIKANVEWEIRIDEEKEFYLAEENNIQFNPKESHSGYFKFWLYRDNYDYAKTKIKDKEGSDEIEQAQMTEEQNPMQIYFKNFSMENLSYRERKDERDESKQKDWEQVEQKKSELLKDEQKDEKLSEDNDTVRKNYLDAFLNLVWDNKDLSKIIENLKKGEKMELSIKDVELIQNVLCNIQDKARKDLINEKIKSGKDRKTAKIEVKNLGKYCMDPKAIKKYKMFNCSWASFMIASIIESLWWTVYMTRVYHHVICMAELQGKQYAIDTNHNRNENITNKVKIEDTECDYIKKFSSKRPLFKIFTEWYVFGSFQEAEKIINESNYQTINEPEYEEAYKKITELLTEEKINSYPKGSPIHAEFPEFDRKIYDIEKKKWKANIFWKVKLKVQERFTRLKRRFSRKK